MVEKVATYCTKIIAFSFYSLFFLVPLVLSQYTSELFELNKIWLTFGITIVVMTSWITKMIVTKEFRIQKTPFDLFLLLFLLSQTLSTIFSIDTRVSWWGYYSRFNGGLLSTICYILLYYAFASTLTITHVKRVLKTTLISGLIVALWGLPSHFGNDPTCLLFRGTFDVSCWTDAFKPQVRIFSTLGQPAWMAAYLAILLPLTLSYLLKSFYTFDSKVKNNTRFTFFSMSSGMYLLLLFLFYVCLIYANTRAGFLAFWAGNSIFWLVILVKRVFPVMQLLKTCIVINILLLLFNFFLGIPVSQLSKFTLSEIQTRYAEQATPQKRPQPITSQTISDDPSFSGANITDSGNIRLIVWQGAIDAWRANPILGSGVETFAFTYYKHRPVEHNLTSEWDYLYNKAHNEYLNYLATTGLLGLGTYLLYITWYLFTTTKRFLMQKLHITNKIEYENFHHSLLSIGLLGSFVTILVSNFFGFSVVIINLYLLLIPLFAGLLLGMINPEKAWVLLKSDEQETSKEVSGSQWASISFISLIGLYFLFLLFQFRQADKAYALGNNLNKVGETQQAYPQLKEAVTLWNKEPVFKDEYSINLGTLATQLYLQQDATTAAQLAEEAIRISNEVTTTHPNNVVFWKTRVRLFYTLSQVDAQFLPPALQAIQKAYELAPTDAKIMYNLGVLQGQNGDVTSGIRTLERTIQLKPDYQDAYYALGLFYREAAVAEQNAEEKAKLQKKADETMQYILTKFNPEHQQVLETLESWKE